MEKKKVSKKKRNITVRLINPNNINLADKLTIILTEMLNEGKLKI